MSRYSATEQIGVHAVGSAVVDDLGWIFREQPIADMGIDAHIELVEGEPTGKLIGVQIKTGRGNFKETKDAYTYYGSDVHLDYWSNHSLPVILVAHIPETKETLWVLVNQHTVTKTKKGWKIDIPKTTTFGAHSRSDLEHAFDGTPRQQKLRQLAIHEPLMRHVQEGKKVSVDLDEWVNKSLGRSTLNVYVYDEHGDSSEAMNWMVWYVGMSIPELVAKSFPWFDANIDQDFYDDNIDEESIEDARDRAADIDNGIIVEPGEDREEYRIYPYHEDGEIAVYRLEFSLNDLGNAYLTVADYLDEEPISRKIPPPPALQGSTD